MLKLEGAIYISDENNVYFDHVHVEYGRIIAVKHYVSEHTTAFGFAERYDLGEYDGKLPELVDENIIIFHGISDNP